MLDDRNDPLDGALRELYRAHVPDSFHQGWQNAVMREEIESMSRQKKPKMKAFVTRAVLPAAATLVLVLGAAWVGTQDLSAPSVNENLAVNRAKVSYSAADSGSSANNAMYAKSYDEAAPAAMSAGGSDGSPVGDLSGSAAAPVSEDSRKLVRTASLTLRTVDFDQNLSDIEALLSQLGGYVENTWQSGDSQNGDLRSIDMSLQVPSNKLDTFLSGVGTIGRVVNRSESVVDMTVQYRDNEARLNTLREKQRRLNELLLKAESVSDIVEIESAISDTQYMLDSYETSQRSIDRQVDMSQVSLSMTEDNPVAVTSDMDMGQRVSSAFQTSLEATGRFLRNMLVFLVMALPVAVPLTIIVIVVVVFKRRSVAKQRAASPEKAEDEL